MIEYANVVAWAESKSGFYLPKAIEEFMGFEIADAFLIAYCKANDCKLVTSEVSKPDRRNRIHIPQPCDDLEVDWLNMIEMFRELGVRF